MSATCNYAITAHGISSGDSIFSRRRSIPGTIDSFLNRVTPPSNIYFTPLVQPRSPMRKHTSFDVNNYDNDITVAKMPQRIAWHRFLQFCTHRKSNALIRVPWIFLPAKNALINELPTVLHL